MSASERIPRIGVIGTGWWATQFHLPALAGYPGAELAAIADTDPEQLRAAAEAFGVESVHGSGDDLIASGDVDAVLIAVPHKWHYPLARAALDAGLHALVEKPLVIAAADAWDLVQRAERNGLHLMVGMTYQFTPHATACAEAVAEIGDLLHVSGLFASMVEAYYRGDVADYADVFNFPITGPQPDTYSDPEVAGGGQGYTQVSHAMGVVLSATGDRVSEVSAYMANHDLPVDLTDAVAFRTVSGATGTLSSTGSLQPGQPQQQEFRFYGSEGAVLQDLLAGTLEIHRNGRDPVVVPALADNEIYPAHLPSQGFADLVAGHGSNPAPGEVGAKVVEFLEACYVSTAQNRSVAIVDVTG